MNIYHVSQGENNDYDTYSDFVIACDTEEEARNTHPDGKGGGLTNYKYESWATKKDADKIVVELIGITNADVHGIICKSFHAG